MGEIPSAIPTPSSEWGRLDLNPIEERRLVDICFDTYPNAQTPPLVWNAAPSACYVFHIMEEIQGSNHDRGFERSRSAGGATSMTNPTSKAITLLSNDHPFVKRIASKAEFEEIKLRSHKLNMPDLLNVGRRTWMHRSGQAYISAFYLSCHHTGYHNTIHGGMMMALVDDVIAEYCNQAAPSLYSLTKKLWFNFIKPSPSGALFFAIVSTSRPFPFTIEHSKEVCAECEIYTFQDDDSVVPVVSPKALFVLCNSLPRLSSGRRDHNIEELLSSLCSTSSFGTLGGDDVHAVGSENGSFYS